MNLTMAILTIPAIAAAIYVTHWRVANRRKLSAPDRIGGSATACFVWILAAFLASLWLQL